MIITLSSNILLFIVFPTKIDFLIIYRYLITECGKIFTLSHISLAYYYVKVPIAKGQLTMLKVTAESQSQTFI